ncbi:hypothetical protein WSS15_23940 [Acetobacter pasteurianus]|uniref:phage fiber-tail adaptor protein n=1 Tax=Acetobacter pasteurianus TaxID=438 RepID=UPI0022C42843|nr:hypothetical protein [Acetobacter pasteurianus]GLH29744.1 hypothetical protein WSS15_23940 [Acetobacter pasteurianus]
MTAPIPSPIWQPAASRVIPIAAPANLRTRGLVPEIVTLSWAPKSSADHFDFSLDLSEILSCTGDYVASVSASVPTATGVAADLAVLWTSIVNGLACVFLGGGEPGTTQTVSVEITTQQGRIISQDVLIAIASGVASTPNPVPTLADGTPVPPNAMRLPDKSILSLGASVTDQTYFDLLLPDGTSLQNSMLTNTPYLSDLLLPDGAALQGADGNALGIDAVDTQTELIGPLGAIEMQTNTDILLIA